MRFSTLTKFLRRAPIVPSKRHTTGSYRPRFDYLEERRLLAVLWVDNNPANFTANPSDYRTIAAAVAAAAPNDTIRVSPGVAPYFESVVINKPLTIIGGQARLSGETGPTTLEVPNAATGFVVQANNVTINSFTIRPRAGATSNVHGIDTLAGFSGAQILNNTITGNTIGLYMNNVAGSRRTLVQNNTFTSNNLPGTCTGSAIWSDLGMKNTTISDNVFTGHGFASMALVGGNSSFASLGTHNNILIQNNRMTSDGPIMAINMSNATITNNRITSARDTGIYFGGAVQNTTISRNTLTGAAGTIAGIEMQTDDFYLPIAHDQSGNEIANSNISVTGNTISGYGDTGIWLRDGAHHITVDGNSSNNNGANRSAETGDGISLENASDNIVRNNTASGNNRDGIRLTNAHRNTLERNTASSNRGSGILLTGSNNNTLNTNTASSNGNMQTGVGDGIRLVNSNSNTLSSNTTRSNARSGIHVVGNSSSNTMRRNTSSSNRVYDLEDETTGTGSSGTRNTWTQNTASNRSPKRLA